MLPDICTVYRDRGIYHVKGSVPVLSKPSERSERGFGIWVPRGVSLWAFVPHLLPRGWTGQAQTFRVSSAHMGERLPIYGFLKNSNIKNFV